MTSSSDPFSKSELEDVQRWALPDISRGDQSFRSGVSPNSMRRMTVEAIEEMQRQAFDEAAEQGHKDGLKKGYAVGFEDAKQKGYEKGYGDAKNDIQQTVAKWVKLMESLEQPFNDLDDQVEEELVALAIGIARHVVDHELMANPEQVIAVVKKAMQVLPACSRKIRLYLHPDDAELIRSGLALDNAESKWTIIEEPSFTRGGCKVDTENSRIDATVEKRLSEVISSVYGNESTEDLDKQNGV